MKRRYLWLGILFWLALPTEAHALFGVGDVVFDPTMYASQLQQLQQETTQVTTLAQQLQYMVKNTTGGNAGLFQSNQGLLTNLGDLITEQQGCHTLFRVCSSSSVSSIPVTKRRLCQARRAHNGVPTQR